MCLHPFWPIRVLELKILSIAPPPLHPRFRFAVSGVEAPFEAVETALIRGRFHHAWLLAGPQGVGKATFAYQVARRLLGSRPAGELGNGLFSDPDDPVCRMISAQSHPDLLVLERWSEANPNRKLIPVDEARRLPEFFSKSPVLADYRVAIVDAADDLNLSAANAVLKTLEEPSGRGVLLLVSHAPGQLLPTIRSRCRRLAFAPWSRARLTDFVVDQLGLPCDDASRLAEMSGGAPGRTLSLAAQGALELDGLVADVLNHLPVTESPRVQAIIESLRGGEGAARFELLMDLLSARLHAATSTLARTGEMARADRWSHVWSRIKSMSAAVNDLNMDRPDAVWSLVADLKRIARIAPLSS